MSEQGDQLAVLVFGWAKHIFARGGFAKARIDVLGDLETRELSSDTTKSGVDEDVNIGVVGDIDEGDEDGGVPVDDEGRHKVDPHVGELAGGDDALGGGGRRARLRDQAGSLESVDIRLGLTVRLPASRAHCEDILGQDSNANQS